MCQVLVRKEEFGEFDHAQDALAVVVVRDGDLLPNLVQLRDADGDLERLVHATPEIAPVDHAIALDVESVEGVEALVDRVSVQR
eukprot:7001757-Prymnesium_polylepis.1